MSDIDTNVRQYILMPESQCPCSISLSCCFSHDLFVSNLSRAFAYYLHKESSYTYPMPPSELRKDGLIVISDYACKIYEIEESQGAFTIKATDIFSGWKHKCVISSDDTADVPHVSSTEYELVCPVTGLWIGRRLTHFRRVSTMGFYPLWPRMEPPKRISRFPVATLDRIFMIYMMAGDFFVCHIYHNTKLRNKIAKNFIGITVQKVMGKELAVSYEDIGI